MGYYIDFTGALEVSTEAEAAVRASGKARELYDEETASFVFPHNERPSFEEADIDQILSAFLPGEEGDTVVGGVVGGYGKFYNQGDYLIALAALGVTGHVDVIGEDKNMWRWRLRDGQVFEYPGQTSFPNDPDDD